MKSAKLIVRMSDARACKMCVPGVRRFLIRYGFDFKDFVKNGIEIEKIEAIDNTMAHKVCKGVRNGIEKEKTKTATKRV